MTIQTINIGNRVNDGLGDDLRTAFEKVNANFIELEQSLTVTASNAGDSGAGIFKQKIGSNLEFKNLVSGRNISLDEFENSISIGSTAPDAFSRFDTDAGTVTANTSNQGHITLEGTPAPGSISGIKDIEVTSDGLNYVRFKTVIPVTDILTTYDFGFISGLFNNAVQLAVSSSNIDFGTVLLPGTFSLDLGKLNPSNTTYD
jgi:hypothetical protein